MTDEINKISGVKDTLKDGENRMFEDYDKNMAVGMIKHHINNMCWVLKDNGDVRNIANFNIFEVVQ